MVQSGTLSLRDQLRAAGAGASRPHGADRCSTTGTEAGAVPTTKGGEPEWDRGVALKAI